MGTAISTTYVKIDYDIYHNMKDKKEDEDSTTKPTSESMRVDHFANLLIHAELEYRYKTVESCQKWREKGAQWKIDLIY